MRPCTRDVSPLKLSLERNNTPYGTKTRKTNISLKLHLTDLYSFFIFAVITGVQMGQMSKLGWLIG
jgi:hypothetical protein